MSVQVRPEPPLFMKLFRDQFTECSNAGLVGDGEFESFKENPNLLPLCPDTSKKIINSGCKGFRFKKCLKFGGKCHSKNPDCIKLRTI